MDYRGAAASNYIFKVKLNITSFFFYSQDGYWLSLTIEQLYSRNEDLKIISFPSVDELDECYHQHGHLRPRPPGQVLQLRFRVRQL